MYSECANPECHTPFDYRRGQLFRFQKEQLRGGPRIVQHLWLCGECSRVYVLEYASGHGVLMKRRFDTFANAVTALTAA